MECFLIQIHSILTLVDGMFQEEKYLYVEGVASCFFSSLSFSLTHLLYLDNFHCLLYIQINIYRLECFITQPYSTLTLVDGMFQTGKALLECFIKQPHSTLILVDGMFQKEQALVPCLMEQGTLIKTYVIGT